MSPEHFQLVADVLSDIAKTLAIIAIAQRMAEATTDDEKVYLSQSLGALMGEHLRSPRIG
jgi:hypothetical protein